MPVLHPFQVVVLCTPSPKTQDLLRPESENLQIRENEGGVFVGGVHQQEVRLGAVGAGQGRWWPCGWDAGGLEGRGAALYGPPWQAAHPSSIYFIARISLPNHVLSSLPSALPPDRR